MGLISDIQIQQVPVIPRSKGSVLDRSLAGVAGSNPAGDMDVCLLWVLCVVRYTYLRRADPWGRGVLPSVFVSLSVIRYNSDRVQYSE